MKNLRLIFSFSLLFLGSCSTDDEGIGPFSLQDCCPATFLPETYEPCVNYRPDTPKILCRDQVRHYNFRLNACDASYDGQYTINLAYNSGGTVADVIATNVPMINGRALYSQNYQVPSHLPNGTYYFFFKRQSDGVELLGGVASVGLPGSCGSLAYNWDFDGSDLPLLNDILYGNSSVAYTATHSQRVKKFDNALTHANVRIGNVVSGVPVSINGRIKTDSGGKGRLLLILRNTWTTTLLTTLEVNNNSNWTYVSWSGTAPHLGTLHVGLSETLGQNAYFDDITLNVY